VKFFELRNWSKYQHYKDRNPPWVKLYTAWPDDYEWSCWSDASKLLAVCIVMLAGRVQNRIPLDPVWIQQRCGLKKTPDLSELFAVGFIQEIQEVQSPEQNASNVLAGCKQDASETLALARSRETETDRGREGGAIAPRLPDSPSAKTQADAELPPGLDPAAWSRWTDYRKQIRKALKPVSIPAAQRELAAFGADQAAVVEQSIANGWQGLFALKERPKPKEEPRRGLPILNG
jgi:hypothetical protein